KLREGSNIGESCGVGGEVVNLIMHGFVNKYHEGFIGRSYIGEWVNLGASTVTSDLKNTYGTIRFEIKGERVDTGLRKLGSFIGDMVRTAIGTKIYTGKKIGVAAQLYGIIAVNVPSFTIYAKSLGAKPTEVYLESVINTQRKFMSSRKMNMSKNYEVLIKKLFEITERERRLFGVKKGAFKLT
ncbi:MAG: glucose-1-phosphate thymidylyltransferase, partial [Thermoprotei archaeon]